MTTGIRAGEDEGGEEEQWRLTPNYSSPATSTTVVSGYGKTLNFFLIPDMVTATRSRKSLLKHLYSEKERFSAA